MQVESANYLSLVKELNKNQCNLVAVSKTKPVEDILQLYRLGQRDFGENYVQELISKSEQLPNDIRWHFIGHLQSNKIKYIAPFIHLIHSVDSLKLLREINKQGKKFNRRIAVLLQVHIAQEETKFGLDAVEVADFLNSGELQQFTHTEVKGLMGMASFTTDEQQLRQEFRQLRELFNQYREEFGLTILSMGMSSDYQLAVEEGSNMVRIGSLIFGER